MKCKLNKSFLKTQIKLQQKTNEELVKSCKITKLELEHINKNKPIELKKIIKISRFININL